MSHSTCVSHLKCLVQGIDPFISKFIGKIPNFNSFELQTHIPALIEVKLGMGDPYQFSPSPASE